MSWGEIRQRKKYKKVVGASTIRRRTRKTFARTQGSLIPESPDFSRGEYVNNRKIALKDSTIKAFVEARKKSGMTQKEISEKTGIAQPDISKLENGNANPSVRTLQRLANAMGMELKVKFQPIKKKKNKVEKQLLQ